MSQQNPNGTTQINRQSTYGGNSSSTRISGSSPNQTVLQSGEKTNGNIKMIGLVPKEVKKAMKSQRTTCAAPSGNQSFGVGGLCPSYASNYVESQQDGRSGKNFSSIDSTVRNSAVHQHE